MAKDDGNVTWAIAKCTEDCGTLERAKARLLWR